MNGGVTLGFGGFIGSGAMIREGLNLPPHTVIAAETRHGMALERSMTTTQETLVIVEAGVNHGDLQIAKKLVDAATEAGADVIKFQTFQASQLATEHAEQATYQQKALVTLRANCRC